LGHSSAKLKAYRYECLIKKVRETLNKFPNDVPQALRKTGASDTSSIVLFAEYCLGYLQSLVFPNEL
jgi:hypothetical protein